MVLSPYQLSRWRFAHGATEVRVDPGVAPQSCDPVWVRPGIQLFLSLPQRTGRPRRFLHGLRILTLGQAVELDFDLEDVEVAPNSLGGVRADEFTTVGCCRQSPNRRGYVYGSGVGDRRGGGST